MPKSKRNKVTSLTKTPLRTTKSAKHALSTEIQNEIDKYDHVWLFSVGDMRNESLKEVRSQWRGTGRLFMAKGKVMQKALGEGEGGEYAEGLGEVSKVSRQGYRGVKRVWRDEGKRRALGDEEDCGGRRTISRGSIPHRHFNTSNCCPCSTSLLGSR